MRKSLSASSASSSLGIVHLFRKSENTMRIYYDNYHICGKYMKLFSLRAMKAQAVFSNRSPAFSLHELLLVLAIIGIATTIALPVVTNFTSEAAEVSAKRNAQLLASVASAAKASGDPVINLLGSKPALIGYLMSSDYAPRGETAKIGVEGISTEDAYDAARYLTFMPQWGGLTYHPSPVSHAGNLPANDREAAEERSRWNAQLLVGAARAAAANGDASIQTAGDAATAVAFLVDGGVGGAMAAGLSLEDQGNAIAFLHYAHGSLAYTSQ